MARTLTAAMCRIPWPAPIPRPLVRAIGGLLTLLFGLLIHAAARGADTTETFDPGTIDAEHYVDYSGIGREDGEQDSSAETVLGYGINSRLSVLLDWFHTDADGLGGEEQRLLGGVLATPLDGDAFDIDVLALAGADGDDLEQGVYTLTLELNYDADPAQAAWGIYVDGTGTHIYREEAPERDEFDFLLGVYLTAAEGQQLLAEYRFTHVPDPDPGERRDQVGGIALGYNAVVHPSAELITELFYDIPQGEEEASATVLLGIIGTIGL